MKKILKILKRYEEKRKEQGREGSLEDFIQYMTQNEKELVYGVLSQKMKKKYPYRAKIIIDDIYDDINFEGAI